MSRTSLSDARDNLGLSRTAIGYLSAVILAGFAVSFAQVFSGPRLDVVPLLVWTVAFLAADAMWFSTPSGRGTVSMASTVHLAALPVLGAPELVVAAWASRIAVGLVWQRKVWYRAVFNGAQLSLALTAALVAFRGLAPAGTLPVDVRSLLTLLPAFGVAAGSYYLLNTGLVCMALTLFNHEGLLPTWRANYGYRSGIVSSLALVGLAPLAAMTYLAFGYVGLAVFLLPIWFIRGNWHRQVALQQTQRAVLDSACTAAKGEMVASVGNELQTYISFLAADLKSLDETDSSLEPAARQERLAQLAVQVERMARISQSLMDSSHLEIRPQETDVVGLVGGTLAFLRNQGMFRDITVVEDYDPLGGTAQVDARQIERAMMELLLNAADAVADTAPEAREIAVSVRWSCAGDELILRVANSGPRIPEAEREQIFKPGYTTKPKGNGIGLSSVKRVVENHRGTIAVEPAENGGTVFQIVLPAAADDRDSSAA